MVVAAVPAAVDFVSVPVVLGSVVVVVVLQRQVAGHLSSTPSQPDLATNARHWKVGSSVSAVQSIVVVVVFVVDVVVGVVVLVVVVVVVGVVLDTGVGAGAGVGGGLLHWLSRWTQLQVNQLVPGQHWHVRHGLSPRRWRSNSKGLSTGATGFGGMFVARGLVTAVVAAVAVVVVVGATGPHARKL